MKVKARSLLMVLKRQQRVKLSMAKKHLPRLNQKKLQLKKNKKLKKRKRRKRLKLKLSPP